jgi:zinc finger protein
LLSQQPIRRVQHPDLAEKIELFTQKLKALVDGTSFPFSWVIQDPSGNSYVQNLLAPQNDPKLQVKKYNRTVEELEAMGYSIQNEEQGIVGQKEQ